MATPPSPEAQQQPGSPLVYWQYFTDGSPDISLTHSPRSPSTGSVDFPLLPDAQPRIPRSHTVSPTFVSSPLNPTALAQTSTPPSSFNRSRTQSRQSMTFNRIPSEESQALTSHRSSLTPNRTSMLLYRLADADEQPTPSSLRHSIISNSGDSVFNVSYDSKYPSGAHTPQKLVPYPFDPSLHIDTPEDDDALHDPSDNTPLPASSGIAIRGFLNIGVLILVILGLLCLFIFYPVWHYTINGNSTLP